MHDGDLNLIHFNKDNYAILVMSIEVWGRCGANSFHSRLVR